MSSFRLGDIAAALSCELVGSANLVITRIGPLAGASPSTLSFLSNPRYQSQLAESAAGCVILSPDSQQLPSPRKATLIAADPYLQFARLTQWWARQTRPLREPAVHPSAVIDASAVLGPEVSVGPLAVIEAGAVIEEGAVIGAQSFVGERAFVGRFTRLAPRVVVNSGCRVGDRCILHSGVVIGADGFGFAPSEDRWEKIEQLGGVRVGNDVEIGANTCVDRGALDDTVIEDGVKLDNLIQIGHNAHIGAHTAMAGCVGVAGSARIGAHCTVGGGAIVLGHLSLADHVHVSAASVVMRSISKPGHYSGVFPIDDNASWEKNAATLRQLHGLRARLIALEKKLP